MNEQPRGWLPTGTRFLGSARCSEAEPQCTDVYRTRTGDLLLANHHGETFTIPADEVGQVLEFATRR